MSTIIIITTIVTLIRMKVMIMIMIITFISITMIVVHALSTYDTGMATQRDTIHAAAQMRRTTQSNVSLDG